jgi:hypothetical protein
MEVGTLEGSEIADCGLWSLVTDPKMRKTPGETFATQRESANSRCFGTRLVLDRLGLQGSRQWLCAKTGEFWSGESCLADVLHNSTTPIAPQLGGELAKVSWPK